MLAFGDSLTEGYCRRGTAMRPYAVSLQSLLRKADTTQTDEVTASAWQA